MGRTKVDYGCDASIRKTLNEAIESLCRNGFCDAGTVYSRKVKYMNGGPLTTAWSRVEIEGTYDGPQTRGNVQKAVEKMITPDTAVPAIRRYSTGNNWNPINQRCKMSKFSNYIHVHKQFNPPVNIQIRISLHTTNSNCIAQDILNTVAGTINPVAGGFFGLLSLNCK
ncbi:hypothetical protein EsH8_II_001175 [Colletotrichum jinshuiense]